MTRTLFPLWECLHVAACALVCVPFWTEAFCIRESTPGCAGYLYSSFEVHAGWWVGGAEALLFSLAIALGWGRRGICLPSCH